MMDNQIDPAQLANYNLIISVAILHDYFKFEHVLMGTKIFLKYFKQYSIKL